MQVMFKNQHSAWLHSVYKYFYSLQIFHLFFFFFNISWPKSSSKRKAHNKARLSMANDAFVFHLRKALLPETVCPARLLVPAHCLPRFPQGGPTLADCRTTQRSRLHWWGKQNATRKITWILPGPPTWSRPAPGQPCGHQCLPRSLGEVCRALRVKLIPIMLSFFVFHLLVNASVSAQARFRLLIQQREAKLGPAGCTTGRDGWILIIHQ